MLLKIQMWHMLTNVIVLTTFTIQIPCPSNPYKQICLSRGFLSHGLSYTCTYTWNVSFLDVHTCYKYEAPSLMLSRIMQFNLFLIDSLLESHLRLNSAALPTGPEGDRRPSRLQTEWKWERRGAAKARVCWGSLHAIQLRKPEIHQVCVWERHVEHA